MRSRQSNIGRSTDLSVISADQTTKVLLARKLNELIEHRGLNQSEVAEITGMTQPKVSQVRRCQLQNISLERLMQALVALGQRVEIVVQPASLSRTSGITVAQR
jgi:predicted XRE-type DNA-binding protein